MHSQGQPTGSCGRLFGTSIGENYDHRRFHHERTFTEVKRLSSAGLEGPELLRQTVQRLRLTVPFESYGIGTVDPATNLLTHLPAAEVDEGSIGEATSVYPDGIDAPRAPPGGAALREDRGKPERCLLYREFLKPLGVIHGLGSVFADGNAWGAMAIVRGADASDFDSRATIGLICRIAPHVGVGLKAAVLRCRVSAEPEANDAPRVLTLDRRGHLLSSTSSAE